MKTLILLLLLTVGAWGQEGYREGALLHYRSSTTTAWAIVDTNSVIASPDSLVGFTTYKGFDAGTIRFFTPSEAEELKIIHAERQLASRLVYLWDAYAKECESDSTKHERTSSYEWGGPMTLRYDSSGYATIVVSPDTADTITIPGSCPEGRAGCLVMHWQTVPRFYWTHRTPTFPGFIEYLRRQR